MLEKNGKPLYIGLDVGGSAIKAGIVSESGIVLHHNIMYNNALEGRTWEAIKKVIQELINHCQLNLWPKIQGIGIAVPGRINPETGVVLEASNLRWSQFPLQQMIIESFRLPTIVMNDSNAATLGEYYCGDINSHNFMCITLGTGIGAGVVLDGKLHIGPNFRAGEIGHMVFKPDGLPCSCGKKGCLETIASGSNMVKNFVRILQQENSTSLTCQVEADLQSIRLEDIVQYAKQGNSLAIQILKDAIEELGLAITYAVQLIDIDTVVLSGGVANMDWPFIEQINQTIEKYSKKSSPITVLKSKLINFSGIFGVTSKWIKSNMD